MPVLFVTILVVLVIVSGVWLYTGPLAPEASLNFDEGVHASGVTPRRFTLWELHSDDTVRVVELITQPGTAQGTRYSQCGQSLWREDDVVSEQWMGASVVDRATKQEVYRGTMYVRTCYLVDIFDAHYGYDMRLRNAPHLHIQGNKRLISIGIDPKVYAQEITAVAIPMDARIERVYDYQPYLHIARESWDILYYDTTTITGHVSIHISYAPGDDASPLDAGSVESSR